MSWGALIKGGIGDAVRDAAGLAATEAYQAMGEHFHANMKDNRFTQEHAREAGYEPRAGSKLNRQSREFKRSYMARKLKLHGHERPLEFTGKTRRSTDRYRVDAVSGIFTSRETGETQVRYPGARGFSRRSRGSAIDMRREFLRITDREAEELARVFEAVFASHIGG